MDVQCCVCKKLKVGEIWATPDPTIPLHAEVSHGYCPTCAVDAFREVQDYIRYNLRGKSVGPIIGPIRSQDD